VASFLKNLFRGLRLRARPAPGEVHVAVFGKHPGWMDHVELGVGTERLVDARQCLYVEGIAGNVDAGTWERLAPEQRLAEFNHDLAWHFAGEVLAGRIWSSRDGKGRSRYPLIACAQCVGVTLPWATRAALPVLDGVGERCRATESAEGVAAAVGEAQAELGAQAAREVAAPLSPAPLPPLVGRSELGENDRGLFAVLYQLERLATAGTAHLRVPACAETFAEAAALWVRFVVDRAGAATPVLAMQPRGENWLDLLVGRPAISDFYCLLAKPGALPFTTDIPYNLEPEFVARARALLAVVGGGGINTK
jgi:hypothetical protein